MARPDFPLNIDRRRLLAAGAAVATAAIALRADRVDAALADTVQIPALTPEVPPLNVCAATARRESALNRLRITIKAARGKTAWLTLSVSDLGTGSVHWRRQGETGRRYTMEGFPMKRAVLYLRVSTLISASGRSFFFFFSIHRLVGMVS
jgi:hypothetical protein